MAKKTTCKPSATVSKAGRTLSKSKSKPAKSKAGSVLVKHKTAEH